jgi:hypothetical protein
MRCRGPIVPAPGTLWRDTRQVTEAGRSRAGRPVLKFGKLGARKPCATMFVKRWRLRGRAPPSACPCVASDSPEPPGSGPSVRVPQASFRCVPRTCSARTGWRPAAAECNSACSPERVHRRLDRTLAKRRRRARYGVSPSANNELDDTSSLLHCRPRGSARGAAAPVVRRAEAGVRSPAPGSSTRPVVRY